MLFLPCDVSPHFRRPSEQGPGDLVKTSEKISLNRSSRFSKSPVEFSVNGIPALGCSSLTCKHLFHVLDTLQCFCQFIVLTAEGDADIPFPVTSEDKSGSNEHSGFMQHVFSQFFHVCTAVGYLAPEEHAYLVFVVGATQGMHDFSCQLTAVAVIRVVAVIPVLLCFQGSGGLPVAWHGTYRCRCCSLLSISIARSRHSRQACRYAIPACCGFCSWN